ncbi:MAG: MgtC/SapB family protein [Gemmatimonadota bacterium]|nr:MgtC/SapB family protein [Gemmatimonadota bacterium]
MPAIDWAGVFADLGLALAAFGFAFPIGYERHRSNRPAGLRTFPIVALACCAFVLIGQRSFPGDAQAQARIVQGLMTGIGFIGGGAILKEFGEDGHVVGIATAASIWNVGAIGAAVGFQRFEVAITLSLVNYLILRWLRPAVEGVDGEEERGEAEA